MGGGGGEPKGLLVLPLKLLVGGGAAPTPGPPSSYAYVSFCSGSKHLFCMKAMNRHRKQTNHDPAIAAMHGPHSLVRFGD